MSGHESFAEVVDSVRREHGGNAFAEIHAYKLFKTIDRLQAAHDREMHNPSYAVMREAKSDDARKLELMREYHRGWEDGRAAYERELYEDLRSHFQHAKFDPLPHERREVAERLRGVHADAGGFVKALAAAVGVEWEAPRVTQTIARVRDRLVYLLDGRREAANLSRTADSISSDAEPESQPMENAENHQLGQDDGTNGTGNGTCPDGVLKESVADELRECVETATKSYDDTPWFEMCGDADEHTWCSVTVAELNAIADRIDARVSDMAGDMARIERENDLLRRAAERDADVMESLNLSLEEMTAERDELREKLDEADCAIKNYRERLDSFDESERLREELRADLESTNELLELSYAKLRAHKAHIDQMQGGSKRLREECDGLRVELDELKRTHMELPTNAGGRHIRVGDEMRTVGGSVAEVIGVGDGTVFFIDGAFPDGVAHIKRNSASGVQLVSRREPDTLESIIRDLHTGRATEGETIERIGALYGQR